MKAQNLAICVPNKGCNKHCPYCVSRMTGYIEPDFDLMRMNSIKVRMLAQAVGVSSVLFTGKGEPLMNKKELLELMVHFRDFPCELQTNGILLQDSQCPTNLSELQRHGLNVLAVSFDKFEDFELFSKVFHTARKIGLVTRVTLNITDMLPYLNWDTIIKSCQIHAVSQFSLRRITIPTGTSSLSTTADWIKAHNADEIYENLTRSLASNKAIRRLPYGSIVYDLDGVAVTAFDYCIQDEHKEDDIRSLIFQEDGHLYTAWNSPASVLF